MSLQVLLPTGSTEQLEFSVLLSAYSLKVTIEKRIGIPYELQKVYGAGKLLDDNKSLGDQHVCPGGTIKCDVDMWWNRLVSLALQGNTATLGRRVSIPMQQIGESNRILTTLLICATRGNPKGVDNLLIMHKDFDLASCTQITGRTILHAAVLSGSLKCVEQIKKYAGMKFEQLLRVKDKSGQTPLDGLTANDTRMLNYVNKFLSSPIDIEQLKNIDNKELVTMDNSYIVEPSLREIKERNKKKPEQQEPLQIHVPLLERNKENNKPEQFYIHPSSTSDATSRQAPMISVAPIIIENTENGKSLTIGESKPVPDGPSGYLPVIPPVQNGSNVQKYSPRPARKASQSSYVPHISNKQPRPPSQEKKRPPVAGKMMDSNLKKFSAASRPRFVPDHHLKSGSPQIKTPVINTDHQNQHQQHHLNIATPVQRPMSPGGPRRGEEKKVRRISLIKSPRPLSPSPYTNANTKPGTPEPINEEEEPVIIEIEEERINKPWNNWIKAVTVEVEPEDGNTERVKIDEAEENQNNKGSATLQVNSNGNARKKSFDKWVQEKAQEEQERELQKMREAYEREREEEEKKAAHHGKSFDDWIKEKEDHNKVMTKKMEQEQHDKERREAEEKAKQQGKSFDQWVKEKAEYERLVKLQHDQHENDQKPVKTLKGRTFEEWQKENDARRKQETEQKKTKEAKAKEQQEEAKVRRRKESSAKYQQWLMDKEKMAFEKEIEDLKKRKVSTAKNANSRRISTLKKPTAK